MNSYPLVSLIVPTYNCVGLLGTCLDTLETQDYPAMEILVMDGDSKDGTPELARARGGRVRVRSEQDGGIYDAMNKGIDEARGEWLYFIGADDSLADSRVVSDVMASQAAQESSTLMVYGNVDSPTLGPKYRGEIQPSEIFDVNICHQAIFHRRALFEAEGRYDLRYRTYADWDLNLRAFLRHPDACRYVDRIIANYTGGTSAAGWDKEFFIDLPGIFADYVSAGNRVDDADETRARLTFQALRAAWMKRSAGNAARLLAGALVRPSILPRIVRMAKAHAWSR